MLPIGGSGGQLAGIPGGHPRLRQRFREAREPVVPASPGHGARGPLNQGNQTITVFYHTF